MHFFSRQNMLYEKIFVPLHPISAPTIPLSEAFGVERRQVSLPSKGNFLRGITQDFAIAGKPMDDM